MAGSAADAISQAVERSKQLLFPFKVEKWFALGFTVFLAQCGEGNFNSVQMPSSPFGGGSRPSPSSPRGSGGLPADLQQMVDEVLRTVNADLALYVGLAIGTVLTTLGLSVFILWFSSRAKLMLVESVVWDRVDVGRQWTKAAELGASLFKFRLWLALAGWLLLFGSVALGILVGFADLKAGNVFGPHAVMGYALVGLAVVLLGFPLGVATLLLDDFVVPLMVVRNVKVGEAWRICRDEVLSGNIGGLVLFYVLRFVLAIGVAIAVFVLSCVTCCISRIPYLGTVLVLPIFVFWRAYSLYYMEQLGLQIFPAPEPSWVAYDQWRFPR
jgi:hypothetical protein